ncbi:hypothetical protein TNCV_1516061 [Trichonephila clavipes]|nr:hypothetical protein TNCV_1516061 [Trichonephila clavipes]
MPPSWIPFQRQQALLGVIPLYRQAALGALHRDIKLAPKAVSSLHGVSRLESDHSGVADRCVTSVVLRQGYTKQWTSCGQTTLM